ncbi:MAG: endonuclease/exonuclease/phosphatase family protein [Alphaproteobacteria bacterium]
MDDENPIWPALVKAALVLTILALAGGYLGWLHPLGDSLAVGRGYAAGALALLAVIAGLMGLQMAAFGSTLLAMVAAGQVALAFLWPGPPGVFALYQKNLFFGNEFLAEVEADIRAARPLAVTLQEVTAPNEALLAALAADFPGQLHCKTGRRGGTAVLTRLPVVPGSETCADGLAALQVQLEDKAIWVVSVHVSWPWPYEQKAHVDALVPVLEGLEGPVLMAGDFNMVGWGHSVKRLARAARVLQAGPTGGTFLGLGPALRLPIDHAFAPNGGRITLRPALGSDHLGLYAELEP